MYASICRDVCVAAGPHTQGLSPPVKLSPQGLPPSAALPSLCASLPPLHVSLGAVCSSRGAPRKPPGRPKRPLSCKLRDPRGPRGGAPSCTAQRSRPNTQTRLGPTSHGGAPFSVVIIRWHPIVLLKSIRLHFAVLQCIVVYYFTVLLCCTILMVYFIVLP